MGVSPSLLFTSSAILYGTISELCPWGDTGRHLLGQSEGLLLSPVFSDLSPICPFSQCQEADGKRGIRENPQACPPLSPLLGRCSEDRNFCTPSPLFSLTITFQR